MARQDLKWAMEHAQEYPEFWLAVKDSALFAKAKTLKELLAILRSTEGGKDAMLVDPWWTGNREIFW